MNSWDPVRALSFLEKDEPWNSLLIGFISGRVKVKAGHKPLLWSDAETPSLVAATTGQNLIVSAPSPGLEPSQFARRFESLAQALEQAQNFPPGIIGPSKVAKPWIEHWIKKTGAQMVEHVPQGIYLLKAQELIAPRLPVGNARLMTQADAPWIGRCLHEFSLETLPWEATTLESRVKDAENRVEAQQTMIWEIDGSPQATASLARPSPHGYTVNAVYTPPEFRKRGLASAITHAVCLEAFRRGKDFCTLFTDLRNPTSNGIYQRLGFAQIGEFSHVRLKYP